MIGYTLPEIRRLLISLIQPAHPTPTASGPGPAGADDASTRPGSATTGDAATHSPRRLQYQVPVCKKLASSL